MRIEDLVRAPQGKTFECKRDLSSPKGALRTLLAFANSSGGKLLVGVTDPSRRVVGVAEPKAMEERLASLIADSIEPRLLADVDVLPWRRTQLLLVEVHPSALRPHFLKAEGQAGGTYIRLGSSNRRADRALIAELKRRPGLAAFDEEPMADLDSEALDFAALSESFAGRRALGTKDLDTLGIVTRFQGRRVPTTAGVILFGRDRLAQFPDAWIQAGRFAGADKSTLLDRADLTDYPTRGIDAALRFVERNTRLGAEIGRLHRRDVPVVPAVALREALINAVVHADYSQRGAPLHVAVFDDRIEVENPGILLPGLTIEDLRAGVSRLRNRVIGRVFKELGLIEQWGSGIQRMTAACVQAGLPEPDLVELGLRFRVTLRTARLRAAHVDEIERRMIGFVDVPGGRSTAELATQIGRTPRAVQQRLGRLAERGLVVAVGTGPRDPRRRWFLSGTAAPGVQTPSRTKP